MGNVTINSTSNLDTISFSDNSEESPPMYVLLGNVNFVFRSLSPKEDKNNKFRQMQQPESDIKQTILLKSYKFMNVFHTKIKYL